MDKLKRLESKVTEIIHYYEKIISCIPGNVYWLDENLFAAGCNQNVLEMFGLKDISQFKGLNFDEMQLIGKWDKKATQVFKRDSAQVLKTGKPILNTEEPPITHSNGKLIYFLTHRVPILDENNIPIGVVGISIDITERKKLEQSLKEANLAKDEFIANMSHDIRTPLTGIIGMSNILCASSISDEDKKIAQMLSESGELLLSLLNGVLDIASSRNEHENTLSLKDFDINTLIHDVCQLEMPTIHLKNLILTHSIDITVPQFLKSDPIKIHRILLNMLGNAIKFTEHGKIELLVTATKISNKEVMVHFVITDTGIGITKDDLSKVFKKFYRASPSYKGLYKGYGVGLHIVKKYVDSLNGKIQIESELGAGTSFTIMLPLEISKKIDGDTLPIGKAPSPTVVKENPPKNMTVSDLSKPTILLVEDNLIALKNAEVLCNKVSCGFISAQTSEEALELFKNNIFQMVLTDIGLPGISGNELSEQIRHFEKKSGLEPIKIIGLTAHALEVAESKSLKAGMNCVFSKPLNIGLLAQLLKEITPQNKPPNPNHLGNDLPDNVEELFTLNQFALLDSDEALKNCGTPDMLNELLTLMTKELLSDLEQMK